MGTLRLPQAGTASTTIRLTKEQGLSIERLIEKESGTRFSTYLIKVQMDRPNVAAMLAGRKKLSVKTLSKLLSGLDGWEVECRTEFIVQKTIGRDATSASSQSLEEMLFLEDMDMSTEEQLNETDTISITKEK